MGEYIDREETVQKIVKIGNENYEGRYPNIGMVHAANIIKNMPAADVAPVVRCIECEYSRKPAVLTQIYGEPNTRTCTHGPCNRRNVSGDFFCGEGKRRAKNE